MAGLGVLGKRFQGDADTPTVLTGAQVSGVDTSADCALVEVEEVGGNTDTDVRPRVCGEVHDARLRTTPCAAP